MKGLQPGGISVFASQLHTHLTGKRVYTKHFRNGAELPELNRDNHYSPHYQEIRRLQRPVRVLPVRTPLSQLSLEIHPKKQSLQYFVISFTPGRFTGYNMH